VSKEPRIPEIVVEQLSPRDRSIYDSIAGPRGRMGGAFAAWLQVPDIAERVNDLINRLRYASRLDPRIYELITLIVARAWSADFIWRAHAQAAIKAGISAETVRAIEVGEVPAFIVADERAAYDLMRVLIDSPHLVEDNDYEHARRHFDQRAIVEMVTVAGYYSMNAMMCKAFAVE
jgi:4-carboxymuconolactone decarboxylase